MRKWLCFPLFGLLAFIACKNQRKIPDVTFVPIEVKVERFDQAFFDLDSNKLPTELAGLNQRFPYFLEDFAVNILGTESLSDTSKQAYIACKRFLTSYYPVKDSIGLRFGNLRRLERDLTRGFQFLQYYFPSYTLPPKVVTYIGPFDAPGAALTKYTLAIGLQLYAGKDFSFYKSQEGQELFPLYISRRFEPEYIVPNSMKALVEDVYPDQSTGKPLIEEMIEKGKNWYLLDQVLPETDDSLKTGFTARQLAWCRSNEGQIWNYLLQNDLYSIDPERIKTYIGDGPYTQGMPDASPGNIGQWIGWRIVDKYANEHPDMAPPDILKMTAKAIFEGSKYKPK